LSKKEGFITLGDFLQHRYRSQTLTIASTVLCIFALANYILSNLKAMGYLVEGSTGGRISFAQGILVLSLIMVIYETLGGLRSVAWTDVMQGVMLLAGCVVIFVAMEYQYGGLSAAADRLLTMRPDFWQPP
ncbi:MAG TPA: sodium:pantothenate symporter, partial [Candidatus Latescibacteria bacterium]|nr:sodium:pantothenate symporter [Candidatus Latescibacterota bacterium]